MRGCFAKIFLAFLLCSTGIITSINSLDLDINEEIVLNPNTVIVAFKERFDKKIKQLDYFTSRETYCVRNVNYLWRNN